MRSQINVKPHAIMVGEKVLEIWYDKEFIGQVTAGEGPVVKIITKFSAYAEKTESNDLTVIEVKINSHLPPKKRSRADGEKSVQEVRTPSTRLPGSRKGSTGPSDSDPEGEVVEGYDGDSEEDSTE